MREYSRLRFSPEQQPSRDVPCDDDATKNISRENRADARLTVEPVGNTSALGLAPARWRLRTSGACACPGASSFRELGR